MRRKGAAVLGGSILMGTLLASAADPRIDSWYTPYSGTYARIYTSAAAQAAGNAVTTWSNGSQIQSLPAYAGVQEIYSSSNWVYIRTTGLGSHTMGPWQAGFPNLPANQHVFYRLPRTAAVPAAKTLTGLGSIGYFVDGVAMFDSRDGFVWTGSSENGSGTGYWNRDAYVNESQTFDPAYAHQENSGTYHYHANPIALRYLMGDHVDFNPSAHTYSEATDVVTRHSPLLGWVRDGFPIYGPYGYASASNAISGIRRMVPGFQVRNGQRGTDNLAAIGRGTIPAWAARLYNVSSNQPGPSVSTRLAVTWKTMRISVISVSSKGSILIWTNTTAAIVSPQNSPTGLMPILSASPRTARRCSLTTSAVPFLAPQLAPRLRPLRNP